MKATGRILIAAVLSIFIVTLAAESEARRGNYRGRGHLSRPSRFESSHKRNFYRGNYTYDHKNRYRSGHHKSNYKHSYGYRYYGYGAEVRYGYKGSLYSQKHYWPRLYYGHGYRHALSLHLGDGVYGRYRYGKCRPFHYPHWRSYFHKSFKNTRYFADYLVW